MTSAPMEIEFALADTAAVLQQMARLATAHEGWINLQPGYWEHDAPPPPTGLALLFGGPLRVVPLCTWVPGRAGRAGVAPDTLGVQHGARRRVSAELAERGLPLPDRWRRVQDHARRGLVLETPLGTAHEEQLSWLLSAGLFLSIVPLTGYWQATVHEAR